MSLSKIKIERGIPLPERIRPKGRPSVYPIELLAPCDSFFVPAEGSAQKQSKRSQLYSLMRRMERKYPGRKYELRTLDDGIRVWRVV